MLVNCMSQNIIDEAIYHCANLISLISTEHCQIYHLDFEVDILKDGLNIFKGISSENHDKLIIMLSRIR